MTKKTVYVIGAGASAEAQLPTGDGLKNKIALLFQPFQKRDYASSTIAAALATYCNSPLGTIDLSEYLREALHILDALPIEISIDNFLDKHRDYPKIIKCGKLAITQSILNAEKNSLFYTINAVNTLKKIFNDVRIKKEEEMWYLSFFKLLTENCTKKELKERLQSITLIIFNYDRCIEHFLYYALQKSYYTLSSTEAADLVKSINIYHPYGDVGLLPWMSEEESMAFGNEPNAQQLLDLSKRIKTFTEGTDPESSKILEIRKHMGSANRIVFLGFAFHKQNMELIAPGHYDDSVNENINCFATTFGFSDSDAAIIKEQIQSLYYGMPPDKENQIIVKKKPLKCANFFKEYWKSLSF